MSGYSRFDRHEVFEMDDTSFVLDCINKVGRSTDDTAELTNMLYGLFDGFYYDINVQPPPRGPKKNLKNFKKNMKKT